MIAPVGNKSERGYKERLMDLRAELNKALTLDVTSPETFHTQLIQMLNGIEGIKLKSQQEISRLTNQIGEENGRMKACNDMGDLIINIISAFNIQEQRRREEDKAQEAEKAEKAAYIRAEQAALEPQVDTNTSIPGVKIISPKGSKKQ